MTDHSEFHGTWTIDPTHTRLGFSARHAMVTKVRGSFDDVSGNLSIDATNPSASTAEVSVRLTSINTGNADRDTHLRSADFLDVAANPEMTFASTGVKADGDSFVMLGDLTLNGVTRPVEIELEPTGIVTDPFGHRRAGFEGTSELSRRDFGLTWNVALEAGGVLVSDRIKIQLDVSAISAA